MGKRSVFDPPSENANETEIRRDIEALFRECGWLVSHIWNRPAKGKFVTPAAKGFPDLVCLRPPSMVVLEVKSLSGKASPEQKMWINAFDQVPGCEAYVVHPGHWPQLVDLAREGCIVDD